MWAACDLFVSQKEEINHKFTETLIQSTQEHLQFILENLEWNPGLRSNHYLGDLMGLLFGSAHLPRSEKTDAILAFSVQELVREMSDQFLPDGGNFEGSTAYHRLSGEMVSFATALILALPDEKRKAFTHYDSHQLSQTPPLQICPLPQFPIGDSGQACPFPPTYLHRLKKISEFMQAATKPSGNFVQFGDNDSGRFLKLHPAFITNDPITENILDGRHLLKALDALFGVTDKNSFDAWIVSDLIRSPLPSLSSTSNIAFIGDDSIWTHHLKAYQTTASAKKSERLFESNSSILTTDMALQSFPEFGLLFSVPPSFMRLFVVDPSARMAMAVTHIMMRYAWN